MTQVPYPDDATGLPNGIYITQAYTDIKPGNIRNMTSRPIHLAKGKTVA